MYVLFLLFLFLLLLLTPNESSAEVYACPNVDGDTYTESPQRSDCRPLDIQPPPLVYERTYTGKGVEARPSGPWPQGSAEAQTEICGLYREWIMLGRKRYANAYDVPPHGLTPLEITRLNNLDLLFSYRGNPNCDRNPEPQAF
ncbi:MAG: hypothetical protein Q7U76_02690 [Nitrospirota bacterium]|nr:hypothetical protein [Nitrospirota bacterium]